MVKKNVLKNNDENFQVIKKEKGTNFRLFVLFSIFVVCVIIIVIRIGIIQIVQADLYKEEAIIYQKLDTNVEAPRGNILDRNGNELAKSTVVYSVEMSKMNMMSSEEGEKNYDNNVKSIAEILDMNPNEINDFFNDSETIETIIENASKETVDELQIFINNNEIEGINIIEETKRLYPHGEYASQLLGSVNESNSGRTGLEYEYDELLAGTDGRWIINTDERNSPVGTGEYYEPVPGSDIVLTIDQTIQYYAEDAAKRAHEETGSSRVTAIVMEVETGDILALASTPSFDPHTPMEPASEEEKKIFEKLTEEEKTNYLYQMWRCTAINDVYEPGSTMKLLTTAMSLEEEKVNSNTTFNCTGSKNVEGVKLECDVYPGSHGIQTLAEAVANSCNPAHIEMASSLGISTFYDYLNLFGMTEYTGIDYPGEGGPLLQSEEEAGPVGIATIGYGQGINVTPISMITALSSLGNDGNLMQPRLVKEIISPEGESQIIEPNIVRKTVSEETAEEVKKIMTGVVENEIGEVGQIDGYTVGGKTGTSRINFQGEYTNEFMLSFIGMAPMEDPKIAILFINEKPNPEDSYSRFATIPWTKDILENTLRYLNIPYSNEDVAKENEEEDFVSVPNLIGKTEKEAIEILDGKGLKYNISPKDIVGTNFEVNGQYPESGDKIKEGSIVYIYKE